MSTPFVLTYSFNTIRIEPVKPHIYVVWSEEYALDRRSVIE